MYTLVIADISKEPFCIERGEIELFDLGKSPVFRQTFSLLNEVYIEIRILNYHLLHRM